MALPSVSIVTVPLKGAVHLYQSVAPQTMVGSPPPNWNVGSPCCVFAPVLLPATLAGVPSRMALAKRLLTSGSMVNVTVLTAEVARRPTLSTATAAKVCAPSVATVTEPPKGADGSAAVRAPSR